jgi:hypothetical protein
MHRSKKALFDDLIGARKQHGLRLKAESQRGLLVHDQLELGGA